MVNTKQSYYSSTLKSLMVPLQMPKHFCAAAQFCVVALSAIALAACVPKKLGPSDFFRPGHGLVVIGVSVYGEIHRMPVEVEFRKSTDPPTPSLFMERIFEDMTKKPMTYQRADFVNESGMMGTIYVQSLPIGDYEVRKVTLYVPRGEKRFSSTSAELPQPFPFTVSEGRVAYLGTYTAVPDSERRLFGPKTNGWTTFALENRQSEDIAIAEGKMGMKMTIPIANFVPDQRLLADEDLAIRFPWRPITRREPPREN